MLGQVLCTNKYWLNFHLLVWSHICLVLKFQDFSMTCLWLLCWNCLLFDESGNYSNEAYVLCLYYIGVFPSEMYIFFLSDRLHRLLYVPHSQMWNHMMIILFYMEHFRLYLCDFYILLELLICQFFVSWTKHIYFWESCLLATEFELNK